MLRVAAQLFAEKGYHGTGVAEIGEMAGLQRGALYYHIGSKEDLLLVLLRRHVEESLEGEERIAGEKLAADLGPRKAVLLEQENPPARGREHGRRRGSRGARADDDRVPRRHAPGPVISIR